MEPVDPIEPTPESPETPAARERGPSPVDWRAVLWGAVAGLVLIIATATLQALLDREVEDFEDSGWRLVLFVVVLVAYAVAGWTGATRSGEDGADAPLTHGALAGLGAIVLWLPVRTVIWLLRDEERGLLRGTDAALRPGQVVGQLVIATGIGMLGGLLAARTASRRAARSKQRMAPMDPTEG